MLRLRKKMGLVELGRHSGLSAAMLSKIERGRLVPTLPTLLRIALVFSVGLDHFFGDPARRPALRDGSQVPSGSAFPSARRTRTRPTGSSRSIFRRSTGG